MKHSVILLHSACMRRINRLNEIVEIILYVRLFDHDKETNEIRSLQLRTEVPQRKRTARSFRE